MTDATSGLLTPETLDLFSQKTRDKVLATSLVLFNQRGFGAVTTASIAEGADVLEGTLWYHFRTKKTSVGTLRCCSRCLQENEAAGSADAPVIIDGIFRSYDVIWDFRYLLRDDFKALLNPEDEALVTGKASTMCLTNGQRDGCFPPPTTACSFWVGRPWLGLEIILVLGRYWMDFSHKISRSRRCGPSAQRHQPHFHRAQALPQLGDSRLVERRLQQA